MTVTRLFTGTMFSVFLLLFTVLSPLYAAEPLKLEMLPDCSDMSSSLELFEDKSGMLTLDEILQYSGRFNGNGLKQHNIGYSDSAWWIRFTINNQTEEEMEYFLLYNQTWTREVDLYIPGENGYQVYRTGTGKVFRSRPVRDRAFVFPVKQKPGAVTMYLRVKSSYRIVLDLSLWSREAFWEKRANDESLYRIFYAVLCAFLFYHVIISIFTRARENLYYLLVLCTYILFLLAFDGTGYMVLWSEMIWWEDFVLGATFIFQNIPVILFFMAFTGAREKLPRFSKYISVLICCDLVMILIKLVFPSLPVVLWFLPLLQVISFSLLAGTIMLIRKGSRQAVYFLVSFSVLLVFTIINSSMAYSIIDESITVHMGMHIGAAFSAILFSLGMSDRINVLVKEKTEAEKTIRDQYRRLSASRDEIEGTNEELQAAMEELEASNEEMQSVMWEMESSNSRLWLSEQRLKAIFSCAPVGLSVLNISGVIEEVNGYALKMLGYTWDELKGKTYRDLTHPDDRAVSRDAMTALLRGDIDYYRLEKRYFRKDGSICWVDISIAAIRNEEGELAGLVGVAQDNSERKKAEEERELIQSQLRQSQKLEAVGTLAGGIAHDFNNILTAILGYTELSLDEEELNERLRDNLEQVLQASGRARDLVKQLLTLSRQGEQEKVPLNAVPLVRESLRLVRATLPSTIEIVTLEKNDMDTILADPVQIQQVILNLCTNANHAMAERGGKLTVVVCNRIADSYLSAKYNLLPDVNYLEITVSDTGAGMSADVLERIFDPFFTTKPQGQGTGLGLSVARGIITNHGGVIGAESEPDKGSAFHVFIPVYTGAFEEKPEIRSGIPGGTERILVIDDEKILAEMNGKILENLGYQVAVSSDSLNALEVFMSSPEQFDVVFTDQTMPGITGIELAEKMLKIKPDLAVVLCTGFSEIASPEKAYSAGIREFLYKPVVTSELAIAVRKALDDIKAGRKP